MRYLNPLDTCKLVSKLIRHLLKFLSHASHALHNSNHKNNQKSSLACCYKIITGLATNGELF